MVDNGSTDNTPATLAAFRDVVVIRNQSNRGISQAWNQGIGAAQGKYVAICNNDIVFSHGWLGVLAGELDRRPELGAVFATTNHQLLVSDRAHFTKEAARLEERRSPGPTWAEVDAFYGSYQAFARAFARRFRALRLRRDCIACSLFRRSAFEACGLFDEEIGPGWEDVDFLQRLLLCEPHYRYEIVGATYIHHFGAVTRSLLPGPQLLPDRFDHKWYPVGASVVHGYHEGRYDAADLARLRTELLPALPFLGRN